MARTTATLEEGFSLEQAGTRAAQHPLVRRLARFGIFCKSVVYTVLSSLALLAAAGMGGRATDSRGAITTISREPYGRVLVAVLVVGLVGLGTWFIVEAMADRDGRRGDWKRHVMRLAKAVAGLMYGGLAWWAAGLALGGSSGPSSDALTRSLTARVIALPGGRLLVAIGGVIALAIAFNQARNGWRSLDKSKFALERMCAWLRPWAPRLAFVGYTAQGLVFALMGLFFLQAAVEGEPHEATGFDGALAVIARQPAGMALLGVIALGLLAYAVNAALESRYKRL